MVEKRAVIKFIHAADIHLDSSLHGLERYEGAPVEEIRSATRRAFDNLIELAIDGGARIERHVPSLPLIRDHQLLVALRRSLAVYRLVFGQPRQDDPIEFLLRHVPKEQLNDLVEGLRIDLSP